jgi:AraC-like DNA-binding protein
MKIDYRKIIVVYLGMQKNPCIELSQDEVDSVADTFHNLSGDINLFKRATYYDEIVLTSIILAAYKIFSILSEHQKRPENQMPNNLQEDYFNRFMELLDKNFRSERSIGFYASKICLTPKYLSSIVKKMSGKAAGEWIDDFVIMEVKSLLKFSKMSIQEIADYMNFPNQSFFAQYFKKHTGVNPSFYRNSQDFLQTAI